MTIKVCVLGSGSSGNCTAIWTKNESLLVDCGRLGEGYVINHLKNLNISLKNVKGIIISHGHSDHIDQTTIRIAKRYQIPIYIHPETYQVIKNRYDDLSDLEDLNLLSFHTNDNFQVGEFNIEPFNIHHSSGYAGKPFGFCIDYAGRKIGHLTDTGKIDNTMAKTLSGSMLVVLEANHQKNLVRKSKRHWANKNWILSDSGHLSNKVAAELIQKISGSRNCLKHVFLAHISEDHNTIPEAIKQVSQIIDNNEIKILPTFHDRPSMVINVD